LVIKEMELGGRTLKLETGRIARQASGSILATYGDTMVIATAVASDSPREGLDFFPLTVEYRERHYAAGKIPGGFFKREGRPTEKEILSARITDRTIRPLFPDGFKNETQVIIFVISADQENDADTLGMIASAAALAISAVPFDGPVAAVKVGELDGELVINPYISQYDDCTLEIIVSGGKDSLNMVEGKMKEVTEARMLEALTFGQESIKKIVAQDRKARQAQAQYVRPISGQNSRCILPKWLHSASRRSIRENLLSERNLFRPFL